MRLRSIFNGKTVLLTGHTGFKGSWLAAWLTELGATVVGVALDPPSQPSHFDVAALSQRLEDHRLDIRQGDALRELMRAARPDFVFHLAAQALVRRSFAEPAETYQTNVLGTLNVLEGLRGLTDPCVAILITSDKSYRNVEWVWGYKETDQLGGDDPYSASKAAAELVIQSHVKSFFPSGGAVQIGVGRAGNVIGGADWAADRIVPDCVRAWSNGETVKLRNPAATRPWQHVLEPLSGYLALAASLHENPIQHGQAFNFGPPATGNHSVLDLVEEMGKHWDRVRWIVETLSGQPKESTLLKLNCDKALDVLRWRPVLDFPETVAMTADWYRRYYAGEIKAREITSGQIAHYMALAAERGLDWAT